MKEQCRTLLELVRPIDSTGWAVCYRIKWQAFLQALQMLEEGVFPCFPLIAWEWIKRLGYSEYIETDPYKPDRVWSIPCFGDLGNFCQPGRDILKAFTAFLRKAGIIPMLPSHAVHQSKLSWRWCRGIARR